MKINYGLVAMRPLPDEEGMVEVLHFCGYENEPTSDDAVNLRLELSSDPQFGLTEQIDGIIIVPATEEMIEFYSNVARDNVQD